MRATLQRVNNASVSINGSIVGKIERGVLVFLGIKEGDTIEQVNTLADKILHLRFLEDEQGKMNCSVLDKKESLLIISQFTLYADTSRGRRPNFTQAARPEIAIPLYEKFIQNIKQSGLEVETGQFGAYMQVSLVNDGPCTIQLNTDLL